MYSTQASRKKQDFVSPGEDLNATQPSRLSIRKEMKRNANNGKTHNFKMPEKILKLNWCDIHG